MIGNDCQQSVNGPQKDVTAPQSLFMGAIAANAAKTLAKGRGPMLKRRSNTPAATRPRVQQRSNARKPQ